MIFSEVKEMMDTVDADGSGTITLDELCVMIGPRLNDMEEVPLGDITSCPLTDIRNTLRITLGICFQQPDVTDSRTKNRKSQ